MPDNYYVDTVSWLLFAVKRRTLCCRPSGCVLSEKHCLLHMCGMGWTGGEAEERGTPNRTQKSYKVICVYLIRNPYEPTGLQYTAVAKLHFTNFVRMS